MFQCLCEYCYQRFLMFTDAFGSRIIMKKYLNGKRTFNVKNKDFVCEEKH